MRLIPLWSQTPRHQCSRKKMFFFQSIREDLFIYVGAAHESTNGRTEPCMRCPLPSTNLAKRKKKNVSIFGFLLIVVVEISFSIGISVSKKRWRQNPDWNRDSDDDISFKTVFSIVASSCNLFIFWFEAPETGQTPIISYTIVEDNYSWNVY